MLGELMKYVELKCFLVPGDFDIVVTIHIVWMLADYYWAIILLREGTP